MSRHYRHSNTRRRMASAHAKHADYCSCGKVVHGNGGRFQHREMHRRKQDGHHGIARDAWFAQFYPEPSRGRSAP